MTDVFVSNNKFRLGERIGKGGEGEVYTLKNLPGVAVKIYDERLRAARKPKIGSMVSAQLAKSTDLVAFPISVATSSNGDFLGFTMTLVNDVRPIHQLYSPKSRKRYFPESSYAFLVRAAQNVARAIASVHQSGCVVGDLNHSGILVAKDATVALIDADSFQFSHESQLYNCLVGVPEFTPPELQGTDLGTVERTTKHDAFGLAVLIFHLLFMGRHPYAGVFEGPDISMSEAIEQNRFAYTTLRRTQTQARPPPGSLTLGDFPSEIRDSFERSFGVDFRQRPSAEEWVSKLADLEKSLKRCSLVETHLYPGAASECVWCRSEKTFGTDMFPDLDKVSVGGADVAFDFAGAMTKLNSFRLPQAKENLVIASVGNATSAFLKEETEQIRHLRVFGIALLVAAFIIFFSAPQVSFLGGVAAVVGFFLALRQGVGATVLERRHREKFETAQAVFHRYCAQNGVSGYLSVFAEVERNLSQIASVDSDLTNELLDYRSNREKWQQAAFLDTFRIRDAEISGIGPAKVATLASFGIETAADITAAKILTVPGFGPALTDKLTNWRATIASKFRYHPQPNHQDTKIEGDIRRRHAHVKASLARDIMNGLNQIERDFPTVKDALARVRTDEAFVLSINELTYATNDLIASNVTVPPLVIDYPLPKIIPKSTTSQFNGRTGAKAPAWSVPLCPLCNSKMVQRTARRGRNAGHNFWGCSRFPSCRGTRNL
jgi:DNA-binding helix-hairpin-helix protein with protein kinase domain